MSTLCFGNIIGLSQTKCDCFGAPPIDYDISDSGLYISSIIPLNKINSIIDCEKGSIWDILERARTDAINIFQGDMNALLSKNYILKRKPYYGGIGRFKVKEIMNLQSGYYAGVRFYAAKVKGGTLIIKNIGTIFTQTGNIEITIQNNLNEILDTYILNTEAMRHKLNNINIELPLYSKYTDNLEYFIYYSVNTNMPRNNDVICNCNASLKFNTDKPYFWNSNDSYKWAEWLMVGGFYQNSISDLSEVCSCTSNNMYGLTFDVELKCDVNTIMCDEYFDFESNPLAYATACAINYKAADILINNSKFTNNVNFDSLINNEELTAFKKEIKKQYAELTTYIANSDLITKSDCLECRNWAGIMVGGILS